MACFASHCEDSGWLMVHVPIAVNGVDMSTKYHVQRDLISLWQMSWPI